MTEIERRVIEIVTLAVHDDPLMDPLVDALDPDMAKECIKELLPLCAFLIGEWGKQLDLDPVASWQAFAYGINEASEG